ncbi:MAG TPA: glycosyltransferase family 4 protein [Candidatus Woesebacteria bacterium]|nr:glycosyltransferase family 4 protein [Candidatus Woesebacteria bacterium]
MKILMLTPYLPYPLLSGGQIRTYNLLKKLSHKHQITLFSLIKNEEEKQYVKELEKYCYKVKVFKRSEKPFTLKNVWKTLFSSYPFLVIRNQAEGSLAAVKKEILTENYDLIHAETFYMMPHIPECQIPIILVEQTIEYLGYESYAKTALPLLRPLLNIDVNKIRLWEKHYWQKAKRLIVMSEEDRQFIAKELAKEKIDVVANGVDTKWFAEKKRHLAKNPTILSVGTFKWLPNIEAVDFLVKKIWPRIKIKVPNANLLIVGNAPTAKVLAYSKKDPQIIVAGRVEDIRDAFQSVHVLLAPVFSGKGTRYKILEAMASGTPVVASKIAVEGLNIKDGQHVLTSNDADTLADLTVKVLNDKKLWQKLSQNGKKFVAKNYDWNLISQQLDKIYQEIGNAKK